MSSMMDFVVAAMMAEEQSGKLTYEEWCNIRRNGTPEEISEAVEKMMEQGGYENLE